MECLQQCSAFNNEMHSTVECLQQYCGWVEYIQKYLRLGQEEHIQKEYVIAHICHGTRQKDNVIWGGYG